MTINIINIYEPEQYIVQNDTPEPWGLFFQDNATPQMEGLEELHNNIMFYLAIVLFAVS
jgi:cytochrome c oxidase subunit 2